jgi:hypothetical protein
MHPLYTTTVTAYYLGDASHNAASAGPRTDSVAPRIRITSPSSGSSSGATTTLVVRGSVSPNKAGRTIGLYRMFSNGYHGVASSTIASNGTYAISVRLARGSYYIKTGMGPSTGNITGFSPSILVHRT